MTTLVTYWLLKALLYIASSITNNMFSIIRTIAYRLPIPVGTIPYCYPFGDRMDHKKTFP
jgi:hypothetical protein